jgi:ABC-type multidrug transport system ATPase subunit
MAKKEREKRIESVVAEVGYKKELGIRPAQLSMGEQKLIAFARAMLCRPELLYLDEWTESLDQSAAHRLIALVKAMRGKGISIILVTHNMQVIRELADIVVMIIGGQIFLRVTKEQMDNDEDLYRYIEKGITS